MLRNNGGDDWNDVPYEHNAEPPYENDYEAESLGVWDGYEHYPKIDIFRVILTDTYNIITPRSNQINSPYSVEDINKGIVPWLTITKGNKSTFIKAGTTLKDTIKILKENNEDIKIFIELKD